MANTCFPQKRLAAACLFFLSMVFGVSSAFAAEIHRFQWDIELPKLSNGRPNTPYGIAVAPNNDFYVAYTDSNTVVKFDSSGELVSSWGGKQKDVSFRGAVKATVDSSGNVHIADAGNDRVMKFNGNGDFLSRIGFFSGREEGAFKSPVAVAVDSKGNVYVADRGNERVQKFSSDGMFLSQWGLRGPSGTAHLTAPVDILVDKEDNIHVLDSKGIITKLTPSGEVLHIWGKERDYGSPSSMAICPFGNIYLAEPGRNRIRVLTPEGIPAYEWTAWTHPDHGELGFVKPYGVAFDGDGNIYVSDMHRLRRFGPKDALTTAKNARGFTGARKNTPTKAPMESGESGIISFLATVTYYTGVVVVAAVLVFFAYRIFRNKDKRTKYARGAGEAGRMAGEALRKGASIAGSGIEDLRNSETARKIGRGVDDAVRKGAVIIREKLDRISKENKENDDFDEGDDFENDENENLEYGNTENKDTKNSDRKN